MVKSRGPDYSQPSQRRLAICPGVLALMQLLLLLPVQATLLQDPGAHKQLSAALPPGLHVGSNTTLAVASAGAMVHGAAGANASVGGLERIEKRGAGMLLA